ncbi:MAG: Holliday junction resolvase RuvX [Clostridia bacterium]
MRKIGLDIGKVRIGVAHSDTMGIIATSTEVFTRKFLKADVSYVVRLAKDKEADTIVVGLPLKMDGTEGQSVQMVNDFVEELKRQTDIKVVLQDERLSTVSAQRILIDSNVRRDKRKDVIDKVAATIILQTYLDSPKK